MPSVSVVVFVKTGGFILRATNRFIISVCVCTCLCVCMYVYMYENLVLSQIERGNLAKSTGLLAFATTCMSNLKTNDNM